MPFLPLFIIFAIVIALSVALVKTDQDLNSKVEEIEPEFLQKKILEGRPPIIIDLRDPKEYKKGHIPGAQSMVPEDLPKWAEELQREVEIVLVCSNGKRSRKIARVLEKGGFEFLEYLEGGMNAWTFETESE